MLSLAADYQTSSSNGDDSDQEINYKSNNKELTTTAKRKLLPSATDLLKSSPCRTKGEVFTNKFLEAERAGIDKLQKHVKMVESEDHITQKNGRKICWNNRRGRCRFGSKCKYAHESDLIKPASSSTKNAVNAISKPVCSIIMPEESNECGGKSKTRKRPGLSDSTEPCKRIMKNYTYIKQQKNSYTKF
uniref:C3H1-type domain-containing protein n=1 Tax=Glossina pallidipes TaxID=7398 RepID=A0A1A9ZAQ9_GLOPL